MACDQKDCPNPDEYVMKYPEYERSLCAWHFMFKLLFDSLCQLERKGRPLTMDELLEVGGRAKDLLKHAMTQQNQMLVRELKAAGKLVETKSI